MIVNLWLNYQIYGFSIDTEKKKQKTRKKCPYIAILGYLIWGACNKMM